MKTFMAAILLATSFAAHAELHERTVKVVCGSQEEFLMTAKKYEEVPYIAGVNQDQRTITSLWGNMQTGTTSWIMHLSDTDEWCMIGVGSKIIIPESSPFQNVPVGKSIKLN